VSRDAIWTVTLRVASVNGSNPYCFEPAIAPVALAIYPSLDFFVAIYISGQ